MRMFLFSSVLIGAEGSFTGHLALFASLSQFLKEIFLATPQLEEDTVLILPETDNQELSQMITFLYGNKREMKQPPSIFRRLGITGSPCPPRPPSIPQKQKLPQPQDMSDHNSNVNPDIEAAEVLIDNDDLLSSSLSTVNRVQTPLQAGNILGKAC